MDRDALLQLIFPEGSSDFLQLSWVVLIFAAVLFAVLFEVSVLAVRVFNPDDDTTAGPGGLSMSSMSSMSSMASVDLPDEEVSSRTYFHLCYHNTCYVQAMKKGMWCM